MEAADLAAPTLEYAGFWIRTAASLVDTVLVMLLTIPLSFAVYGNVGLNAGLDAGLDAPLAGGWADFLISFVLPAVAVIVFWRARQATPGKMLFGLRIVDAATGAAPGSRQLVGRYFAYFVSTIPLCLGFLWVGIDRRKQGWHDKLAGTVVVRTRRGPEPVRFEGG